MKLIAVLGTKGGAGKTSLAHLLCLGASLRNHPIAYVLTDPSRQLRAEGRPYPTLDARRPETLAGLVEAAKTGDGWMIIDGGGNRPAFDQELHQLADVTLLPMRASAEDLDTVAADLRTLQKALIWPYAWPTNPLAKKAVSPFLDAMNTTFPGRVIANPVPFVQSCHELLLPVLDSPSTTVRNVARAVYYELDERLTSDRSPPG